MLVSAHIDAYWSTPGASDNASGTVVLLLLAEMLRDYKGNPGIEIVAFNGEDYYSAGGQMDYLRRYGEDFAGMVAAINVDDVGYRHGEIAYSLYDCPDEIKQKAHNIFGKYNGIIAGEPWYQGDQPVYHLLVMYRLILLVAQYLDPLNETTTKSQLVRAF